MFRLLTLLIAVAALTACRTRIADHAGPDVDLRQGTDSCELHSAQMRTARVPAGIGCVLPYAGYLEARDRLFPHSFPRVLESRKRFWLIYVCDQCIAAEHEWSRTHEPQPNKGAAANRRPAGQLDGSGNLPAIVAADRAFPAAVAELVVRRQHTP